MCGSGSLSLIPKEYRAYVLPETTSTEINYPVLETPDKILSHDLDKAPAAGKLLGIKAKYLILSTGVLNVARFAGFQVSVTAGAEAEAAAGAG